MENEIKPKSFMDIQREVSSLDTKAILLRSDLLDLEIRCQTSNPRKVAKVARARRHVIAAQERLVKAMAALSK